MLDADLKVSFTKKELDKMGVKIASIPQTIKLTLS